MRLGGRVSFPRDPTCLELGRASGGTKGHVRFAGLQLCGAGILNVRAMLMVRMEQHFVQASPIKDFAAFRALREVFLFFRRSFFVFVGCHLVKDTSVDYARGLRIGCVSEGRICPGRSRLSGACNSQA